MITKQIKYLVLFLFLLIFQTVILSRVIIFGYSFELLISFLALVTFIEGYENSFWLSLIIGITIDVLTNQIFAFTILLSTLSIVLGFIREKLFSKNDIVLYIFVFAFDFLVYFLVGSIFALKEQISIFEVTKTSFIFSIINLAFIPYLTTLIEKVVKSEVSKQLSF